MAATLLNEEYVQHLGQSEMNTERKKTRARSHLLSQWHHMSRRWTESEELQYEHQFSYDAYVQAPIDSSAVVSLSKGSTDQVIVVPHCESWKRDGRMTRPLLSVALLPITILYLLRSISNRLFLPAVESIKSHHRNSTISPERFIAWFYAARMVCIV